MANEFNIEEYIKDLTPEQQEKAKAWMLRYLWKHLKM